jgi:hypothetical protein
MSYCDICFIPGGYSLLFGWDFFPNAGTSILGKPWLVFSIIQVILTLWKFDKAIEATAHFVRLSTY